MAEFITKGCVKSGEYVRLNADEEIFGSKDFINDVTVRGDLTVSGEMRVSQIVDFTSESGDISGHVFRGEIGYFDQIIVGDIIGSDSGGSGGESSGGIDTGPIFVTDVLAVGGVREILESAFDGNVIKSIRTASDQVDVKILAERGDAQTFKPVISHYTSGDASSFQELNSSDLNFHSNGYSFTSTIRLDSSVPKTYIFKNGSRQTYLSIERDTPPDVISAGFVNLSNTVSMYGETFFNSKAYGNQSYQQSEAKNGDVARVLLTVSKEPSVINVSGGALSTQNFYGPFVDNLDGTFSAEFNVNVSGASSSIQSKGFSCWVKDLVGNQSSTFNSDNNIILNNSSPSLSLSYNYPNGQALINNTTDEVSVNVSGSNFDKYNYNKSGVLEYVQEPGSDILTDPFIVSGSNATGYVSGSVSVELFKQSNGRAISRSTSPIQIQSFGTTPSLSFSPNLFRSSSAGAQQSDINVSIGEPIATLQIKSVSDPAISVSAVTKVNDTYFSFQISVSDSTPRGEFTLVFEADKIIGETFELSDNGSVRGFSQRSITISATDYLPVDLGVNVFNTSKLTATATPQGGNTFAIPYDPGVTGVKQDGTTNLEPSFGIINGSELVIDNQVITNAGNVLDVTVTVEEVL